MLHKNFRLPWLALGFAALFLIPGFTYALPLTTFETDDFSGSGVCAFCHSNLITESKKDVSMDAHWRSTMMANAAKDPLWQAKISAEVELVPDNLGLEQVIQEKCSRCHMGMARYQQLTDGATKDDIYVFDTGSEIIGFLNQAHYLYEAAMDGVSCTLCHQITPENLGNDPSFTGQYVIDTNTDIPERVIYGPYSNPLRGPMQQNAGFLPADHAPGMQLADSAHCGTCHTLYTPALDANGNYLKEFPEQTTYLEWEYSAFNKTCQDCHLPDAGEKVVISNRPRGLAARTPFGQHHYVGGNSFMVNLLRTNATDLGVTAEDKHLEDTINRTLTQLWQNTAIVTADASLSETGDTLKVTVKVENLAGHKFPSGLPSRRAWLHVAVADTDGNIVFESGAYSNDRIVGNDAVEGPLDFEPHYTEITTPDQVQIYEPVMLNYNSSNPELPGDVTYTLLRAYEYAKDNRLLPVGFDKTNAPDDIKVYGAAANDSNFTDGSDRVVYEVDVSGSTGELTVSVKLLFQALSYPFVQDLKTINTDEVQRFRNLYKPKDNVPVVVAATPTIKVR